MPLVKRLQSISHTGQTHGVNEEETLDLIMGKNKTVGFWEHIGESSR